MRNEASVEKMRQKLTGRPFPTQRGGNGHLTEPQKMLAERLGLPMEVAIPTKPVWGQFARVPNCYKVDLADLSVRLAIEVDGFSHNIKAIRLKDQLKTDVLQALGWSVLRFTNQQVTEDIETCVQTAQSTISKLRATTITSPVTF